MSELSRSQIDRLGKRLRRADRNLSDEDRDLLEILIASYEPALAAARDRLAKELGLPVTPRLKTTGTLVEKLQRNRSMALSRMQDIAGMRVVAEMNRAEQDQLVTRIVELFPGAEVMDRRAIPSYGYRAVHVIVEVDRRLVEIQVRTFLQNLWANLIERLADRWGRGIRYGEPPNDPNAEVFEGFTRQQLITALMVHSNVIHLLEESTPMMAEADVLYAELQARYGSSVPVAKEEARPSPPNIIESAIETYRAEQRYSAQKLIEGYELMRERVREFDRMTRELFQLLEEFVL